MSWFLDERCTARMQYVSRSLRKPNGQILDPQVFLRALKDKGRSRVRLAMLGAGLSASHSPKSVPSRSRIQRPRRQRCLFVDRQDDPVL